MNKHEEKENVKLVQKFIIKPIFLFVMLYVQR